MSICDDERRAVFTKQLAYFLKLDRWYIEEAAQLLVGAIPPAWEDAWPDSDGSIPDIDAVIAREEKLKRIWESNPAHGTHAEPTYYIRWAVTKGMAPPWLSWVVEQSYVTLDDEPDARDKEVNRKSETAYLNIIGALLQIYWDAAQPGTPFNQAAVIRALTKYEGMTGMGERNLKDKFTRAIRSILTA